MSVNPFVPSQKALIGVARMVAVTLTFVCVGPLIQVVLMTMSFICYDALSGAAEAAAWMTGFPRFIWPTLSPLIIGAGLTGLIAGVYDAIFGRVNARTMLVISLVLALASLILFMIWLPMAIDLYVHLYARAPDLKVLWLTVAIQRFCFVVSMLACWKLIDIVRGKASAAGSLTPA